MVWQCDTCGGCEKCCSCDLFDADELGLDPEDDQEDDDYGDDDGEREIRHR